MNEALVHEFAKALGTVGFEFRMVRYLKNTHLLYTQHGLQLAIMSNVCLFWEPRAGRAYVIHEPLLLQRLNR